MGARPWTPEHPVDASPARTLIAAQFPDLAFALDVADADLIGESHQTLIHATTRQSADNRRSHPLYACLVHQSSG